MIYVTLVIIVDEEAAWERALVNGKLAEKTHIDAEEHKHDKGTDDPVDYHFKLLILIVNQS
jgi:hypothetical protein